MNKNLRFVSLKSPRKDFWYAHGGKLSFLAVVLAFAVACLSGCNAAFSLSDDDVYEAFHEQGITTAAVLDDSWVEVTEPTLVSLDITSTQEWKMGDSPARDVCLEAVYDAGGYTVKSNFILSFVNDGGWTLNHAQENTYSIEANWLPDEEGIESHLPMLLSSADEFLAGIGKESLVDLYKENVTASVREIAGVEEGALVTMDVSGTDGFAQYSCELVATLAWNGETWIVVDCSVDDSAYVASYDSLLGLWVGKLESVEGAYGESRPCYAANSRPFQITFKSIDSSAMIATVDMGFVLHDHRVPQNTVEGSAGDTWIELTDVLIPLEFDSANPRKVYETERKQRPNYRIELGYTSTGEIKVEVEAHSSGGIDYFEKFSLAKQ